MRLFVSGAGAVTCHGMGLEALGEGLEAGAAKFPEEEGADGQRIRVGRIGRLSCKDSASSYKRWGQLDTYSRYGFVASRLALEDAGIEAESPGRESMGVLLGTAFGCMEENQRFDRFEVTEGVVKGASPLVFKGTVDNAPAGWVAVAWKLKGPNATFVSGDGASMEALWSAEGLLRRGRAPALLVGGVERFVDLHSWLRQACPRSQGAALSEGSAVLVVEREDSLLARDRGLQSARAELLGVARGGPGLAGSLPKLLAGLGSQLDQVGLVSLAVPNLDEVPQDIRLSLPPGAELVCDKGPLGEFHGAWGSVAICAALARQNDTSSWNGRPLAVVHAYGEGKECFYAVLRAGERR